MKSSDKAEALAVVVLNVKFCLVLDDNDLLLSFSIEKAALGVALVVVEEEEAVDAVVEVSFLIP